MILIKGNLFWEMAIRLKGKCIILDSEPKAGSKALRPSNVNVWSSFIQGRNGFNDGSIIGPYDPNAQAKGFEFAKVNFISNLDRKKHGVVRVVEKWEIAVSKEKENLFLHFGESSMRFPNLKKQANVSGTNQKKKPPNRELKDGEQLMLDLMEAMEGIVLGIEQRIDNGSLENEIILVVEVMEDDEGIRNDEVSC